MAKPPRKPRKPRKPLRDPIYPTDDILVVARHFPSDEYTYIVAYVNGRLRALAHLQHPKLANCERLEKKAIDTFLEASAGLV